MALYEQFKSSPKVSKLPIPATATEANALMEELTALKASTEQWTMPCPVQTHVASLDSMRQRMEATTRNVQRYIRGFDDLAVQKAEAVDKGKRKWRETRDKWRTYLEEDGDLPPAVAKVMSDYLQSRETDPSTA